MLQLPPIYNREAILSAIANSRSITLVQVNPILRRGLEALHSQQPGQVPAATNPRPAPRSENLASFGSIKPAPSTRVPNDHWEDVGSATERSSRTTPRGGKAKTPQTVPQDDVRRPVPRATPRAPVPGPSILKAPRSDNVDRSESVPESSNASLGRRVPSRCAECKRKKVRLHS